MLSSFLSKEWWWGEPFARKIPHLAENRLAFIDKFHDLCSALFFFLQFPLQSTLASPGIPVDRLCQLAHENKRRNEILH